MNHQVDILRHKKVFISIFTFVLVILGIWWGSSLLLNKNKTKKSKTQNVVANQTETIDVSGNQISTIHNHLNIQVYAELT